MSSDAFRKPVPPRTPGPGLARTLGLIAGDLWRLITGRRPGERRRRVRSRQESALRPTPHGPVVLRRTVIEEIELPAAPPAPPPADRDRHVPSNGA